MTSKLSNRTFCQSWILSKDFWDLLSRSLNTNFTGKATEAPTTADGNNRLMALGAGAKSPGSKMTARWNSVSSMTGWDWGEWQECKVQEGWQGQGSVRGLGGTGSGSEASSSLAVMGIASLVSSWVSIAKTEKRGQGGTAGPPPKLSRTWFVYLPIAPNLRLHSVQYSEWAEVAFVYVASCQN